MRAVKLSPTASLSTVARAGAHRIAAARAGPGPREATAPQRTDHDGPHGNEGGEHGALGRHRRWMALWARRPRHSRLELTCVTVGCAAENSSRSKILCESRGEPARTSSTTSRLVRTLGRATSSLRVLKPHAFELRLRAMSEQAAAAARGAAEAPPEVTLFDKIVAGQIPCNKVYEDDVCLAFRDIAPVAKTHVLVIPKDRDGLSAARLDARHKPLLGHLMWAASHVAALEARRGLAARRERRQGGLPVGLSPPPPRHRRPGSHPGSGTGA